MKSLIVTADDFGLSSEINAGIIESHKKGIVRSASLQINAPKSSEAIMAAKKLGNLEIGIHLSLVEGFALGGGYQTLVDDEAYFPERLCLQKDWKNFLKKYLKRNIDFEELEAELRRQLELFLQNFSNIPFANVTQHLQLLPGISDVIIRLAGEYNIRALRVTSCGPLSRLPTSPAISYLGNRFKRKVLKTKFLCTDSFLGFPYSGKISADNLIEILKSLKENETSELMTHPGFDCQSLRKSLPRSYKSFGWEGELRALTAPETLEYIKRNKVHLLQFNDLPNKRSGIH